MRIKKISFLMGVAFSMLQRYVKNSLTFLILGLRPLLGPAECKFPVGCTQYAVEQLEQKNIFLALWLIIKRLLSCSPLS